ncbi:MAG: hypothetical protein QF732_03905 [Nitrospinaceae bacterium]|jgi:hypothetical protein|nr:hypothetical protein [Nitrospinaceae bacterium]MDP7051082.1 hypothetical protein [Verrucomicrobiota bacterium]
MKHILVTITITSLLLVTSATAEPIQDADKNGELIDFKRRSFSSAIWLQSFAKKESSKSGHRWSRTRSSSTRWEKWGISGSITFYSTTLDNQKYKIAAGRVSNWKKYIKTVLDKVGRNKKINFKPGIALFIDGDPMGLKEINLAREECEKLGIRFWFINEVITTGDLLEYQAMMDYLRKIGAE